MYVKRRKSIGNKRNDITEECREMIVKAYGEFKNQEYRLDDKVCESKIFDNKDFGYNEITIESPLKLNFKVDSERVERIKSETSFINLAKSKKKGNVGEKDIKEGKRLQEEIVGILESIKSKELYKNRKVFDKKIKKAFKDNGIGIGAPVFKAILSALSEKDETADICRDVKGNPEPDTELRDKEKVPLSEDIESYFNREVKPYNPNAWIDKSKTKVGYEIPFTRYFYKYEAPEKADVIAERIVKLENELMVSLKALFGEDGETIE